MTSYPAIDITDDFTQTQNLRQLNEISKTELIESLPYQKHSNLRCLSGHNKRFKGQTFYEKNL